MTKPLSLVCLDVGEKRIGVAVADSSIRIAVPFETIDVDGDEIKNIAKIVIDQDAEILVIGYPRNQSGESTNQTKFVEEFAKKLTDMPVKLVFQDESLTSVMAEQRLAAHNRPYSKSDIDSQAAAIILQDYLETNYA
jgi:putative Holliday junction resolvase